MGEVWGEEIVAAMWSGTAESWEDLSLALPPNVWEYIGARGIWSDDTTIYVVGLAKRIGVPGTQALLWTRPIKALCPADITGDGTVNVSDLLAVINAWGPCPKGGVCPADITGDGTVNVSDLLAVINAWGPCR